MARFYGPAKVKGKVEREFINRQSDRRKNGNIMNDEKHLDPEFQISRYLDGDMGDAERAEFFI